jgi:crotonobetainyl-CoA:carnitine CoA-transferase CaiB-like acyl-CoA transferase
MDTPAGVRSFAPRLGEHTAEILAQAGYSAAQIAAMAADRVVGLDPGLPAFNPGDTPS